MVSGGFYALKVKTPSARFPLLLGALESAVGLGLHCAVISGSNPEDLLARLDAYGRLPVTQAVREGKIHVFSIQEDFSKKMFRYTADRFVQELEEFEVRPGSFFIFDQADELLSLHDSRLASEQLQILSKWFYRKQTVGLITLSGVNDQHMATLNSLMDYMSGIAKLGGERDGLELTYLYWQSTRGVAAARNYRLITQADGMYEATTPAAPVVEVRGELAAPTQQAIPIQQEAQPSYYFYMDPALEPLQYAVEGQWVQLPRGMDMLLAARGKSKAMLLVDYTAQDDMWEFAKTVHALRKGLGTSALILVREVDVTATDEDMQLMLRCGANTVIGQDVSLEDYPELLASYAGQVFPHRVNPNFAALVGQLQSAPPAVASVQPMPDASDPTAASRAFGVRAASAPLGSAASASEASVNVFDVHAQELDPSRVDVPRVTYNYGGKAGDGGRTTKPAGKATRRSFASSS
jgi:hypothetical protein